MTTNPPNSTTRRAWFKRRITWLNAVGDQLFHVRFSLITLGAGSAMVLAVPQVRELFFLLAGNDRHWWLAFVVTGLLGLAVWYCGRTVYRFRFPQWPSSRRRILPQFKRIAPRLMGAMVPILMAVGCVVASLDVWDNGFLKGQLWLAGGFFVAEALGIWVLVVYRRPILNSLKTRWKWLPQFLVPNAWHKETLNIAKPTQYGHWVRTVFLGGLAINLLVTLIAINVPHAMAEFLGPIATIMLAGTFFVISGTLITFAGTFSRVPLLTLMVLLAMVLHAYQVNNNHYVRQCPEMTSFGDPADCPAAAKASEPKNRQQPLERYWAQWYAGLTPNDPIFLVSAEGGGIRAAAWTAMVLSQISDQSGGRFDRHVFAASGVSGGSLGIATYVGLIKARKALETFSIPDDRCHRGQPMLCATVAILQQDFLSPNLVNLFFVDTLQRFLPARMMVDRGQRLEESWALSWDNTFAKDNIGNPLEEPFDALYPKQGETHLPLALLNTTVVQSGDRLIQTPFSLFDADRFGEVFPGARNSHNYLPTSMPLNAAVHNSARFTYISPAGTVAYKRGDKTRHMQLVDGGYFENSGTVTLGDIYRWMRSEGVQNPITIIHISNDSAVPSILGNRKDVCPAKAQSPGDEDNELSNKLAGEASAPIQALLNTRTARGENARQQLAQRVGGDDKAQLMHFRLCDGDNQLPLGWALSDRAWEEMGRQLGIEETPSASYSVEHQRQINSAVKMVLN
ncbi:MAG: hypothetical protein AB8B96_11945 [Lysobacterales bacterium]